MNDTLKKLIQDFKRVRHVDWRWLVIWIVIYASFLFLDLFAPDFIGTNLIKYAGIFLCLVYAYRKFRADTLLILALLFTLLADTILIWTSTQIPGIYCFCFAQFFHILRFTKAQPKTLIAYFASIFLLFVAGTVQGFPPVYVIAAIYGFTLLANVALSARWYHRDKSNFRARCAFYGFMLFVVCDICVGLQYLALDGFIIASIIPAASYLVWLFYYPSQILISNSSNLSVKTTKY